jgi:hypothetical protein
MESNWDHSALQPAPGDYDDWWNGVWERKPKYSEETCPNFALSATNTICLDTNQDHRGKRPVTGRLSYGTAIPAPSYPRNLSPTHIAACRKWNVLPCDHYGFRRRGLYESELVLLVSPLALGHTAYVPSHVRTHENMWRAGTFHVCQRFPDSYYSQAHRVCRFVSPNHD